MLVQVAGNNASVSLHGNGGGEALAAGSGAAVQHPGAFLGKPGAEDSQFRGRVLNVEVSLLEGFQFLQVPAAGEHQAVRHPGMGHGGDAFSLKVFRQLFSGGSQGVHLDHGLRGRVIGNEDLFQLAFRQVGFQQRNQFRRMAVAVLVGGRFL